MNERPEITGRGDAQKCRDRASPLSHTAQGANGRQCRHGNTLWALLWARKPPRSGSQRDDWYVYDVKYEGELIVTGSADAECDAARVPLARGIEGALSMIDGVTGKPRTIIDIEKAAKLTVREGNRQSPMFAKWRPFDVKSVRATSSRGSNCEGEAA
jgi:hypothetical protein